MQIYKQVKVKKTNRKSTNKITRIRSKIQYYLIKVLETNYVSTRLTLSRIKEFSFAKLKRIDAQLNRQNKQLLAKLN